MHVAKIVLSEFFFGYILAGSPQVNALAQNREGIVCFRKMGKKEPRNSPTWTPALKTMCWIPFRGAS